MLTQSVSGHNGCPIAGRSRVAAAGQQAACTRRRTAFKPCCSAKQPGNAPSNDSLSRREALLSSAALLSSTALLLARPAAAVADEAVAEAQVALPAAAAAAASYGLQDFSDNIHAYRFRYPTQTSSGKQLRLVLTRKPEKYSSAAPLTVDARQRIVSELFDLRNYVTVSMTVGPVSGVLSERLPSEWKPREVAETVLIDRSTARLSSGQRTALNDVEESHKTQREGQTYWVYEHMSQGSPTPDSNSRETFRHALAITGWRAGLDGTPYLYTLNLSCPQELWEGLEGGFKEAVDSFALLQPGRNYVPPDKDPWLFF